MHKDWQEQYITLFNRCAHPLGFVLQGNQNHAATILCQSCTETYCGAIKVLLPKTGGKEFAQRLLVNFIWKEHPKWSLSNKEKTIRNFIAQRLKQCSKWTT